MTSNKREKAIKYLTEEIRSLRMAPEINGCGPENWADQLEIMETCLEAVMAVHFADTGKMRPLNLCALKEMEKQVVFVDVVKKEFSRICDLKSQFGVVRPEEDRVHLFNGRSVYFTSYGSWLAYAYPPAQIEREAWISVEDRLPPDMGDVLVVAFWHERWQAMIGWHSDSPKRPWRVYMSHGEVVPGGVTYWMPLPEPPESRPLEEDESQ